MDQFLQVDLDIHKKKPAEIVEMWKKNGKSLLVFTYMHNVRKIIKNFQDILKNDVVKICIKTFFPKYINDLIKGKFYSFNEAKKIKFLDEYEKKEEFQKYLDCLLTNIPKDKYKNIQNYFENQMKMMKKFNQILDLSVKDVKKTCQRLIEAGYKKEANELISNIGIFDTINEKKLEEEKNLVQFYKDNKDKIKELKKDNRKMLTFIILKWNNKIYKI